MSPAASDLSNSDELDRLPLLQRRNLLLKPKLHHSSSPLHIASDAAERECEEDSVSPLVDAPVLEQDDKHFDWQNARSTKKCDPEPTNNGNTSGVLDFGKVKVEPSDENELLRRQRAASSGSDAVLAEQNGELQDDDGWLDELDHVTLIHRREMLLAKKRLLRTNGTYTCFSRVCESERPSMLHHEVSVEEDGHYNSPGIGKDSTDHVASRENEVVHPISGASRTGTVVYGLDSCGNLVPVVPRGYVGSPSKDDCCSSLPGYTEVKAAESAKSKSNTKAKTGEGMSSLKRKLSKLKRCGGSDHVPLSERSPSLTLQTAVKVKTEPSDHSEVLGSISEAACDFALNSLLVKREEKVHNHLSEDKLDHMLLRERMNLWTLHADPALDRDTMTTAPPPSGEISAVPESVKPISIKHPRKRRKTVTDSVATALEEDAPGLLRALLDNGVSVDEIKLYGDVDDDDPLDGFAELEDVISKLISQRQTLLKFGTLRSRKDTKTTYCLACLFSLVEQTRFLQFRKWPVEWGWCRDLQSFIFVFERHRRIVLERPEYGYATYFFELVDLPIAWQIKRLVIGMKLTSCSRVSVIENKALKVGPDLTEGEARVLMEYGWTPNSGLGTMLNYCDRVVHDRKTETEKDPSEWRAKIGKMLMDGYNGGSIVSSIVVKKEFEYDRPPENPAAGEVKLEY